MVPNPAGRLRRGRWSTKRTFIYLVLTHSCRASSLPPSPRRQGFKYLEGGDLNRGKQRKYTPSQTVVPTCSVRNVKNKAKHFNVIYISKYIITMQKFLFIYLFVSISVLRNKLRLFLFPSKVHNLQGALQHPPIFLKKFINKQENNLPLNTVL